MRPYRIFIEGGYITNLEPASEAPAEPTWAAPAFINAHWHSEFNRVPGYGQGLQLHEASKSSWWNDLEVTVNELSEAEMIKVFYDAYRVQRAHGTLTLCEFRPLRRESIQAIVKTAANGAGVTVLTALPVNGDLLHLSNESRLTLKELEAARRVLESDPELRFSMHTLETARKRAKALKRFGRSTIEVLKEFGLLGPRAVLVHANHLSETDVTEIAKAGAHLVLTPRVDSGLKSGRAPLSELRKAGANLSVATDFAVTGPADCLLGELAALTRIYPEVDYSIEELLAMITINPARALGLRRVGRVAPGFKARLVGLQFEGLPSPSALFGARVTIC